MEHSQIKKDTMTNIYDTLMNYIDTLIFHIDIFDE